MTPEDFPKPSIPGYTIKSVVGIGGFATVYLAQQHTLKRDIALKVMNPLLVSDSDFCTRFLREAQDTASVSNHPNIITIHDVGHVDSTYYIAMQYLPGLNLKQRIENTNDLINAERVLHDLASALSYVHQKGFIHRDVKPANVLFTESGDAVLSDFGVARLGNRATQLTQQGNVVGTTLYMSPEQCRGDPLIDARSDLYSLGIMLFEVLMRHPAFEATDPMVLMLKHLKEPIPELPDKYAAYQDVLDKLTAKPIDQRYESAAALLDDLNSGDRQVTENAGLSQTAVTGNSSKHRANNETTSSTVLTVTMGVLVLLTGSLVFLYAQRSTLLPDTKIRCPELTQAQFLERDALLQLASVHQEIGRLEHPPGANALEAYVLALDLDPCNQRILDAVANIRRVIKDANRLSTINE
ncbi:MAG: serine/threonine-protein kinase [Granulosicoccus sp.]